MLRRNFLKNSSLLSLSPLVPQFVHSLGTQAKPEKDSRILVVIELNGGNDGINTIVPHKDAQYKKLRPKLALESKQLHTINDDMAFHRAMRRSKEQFDAGELTVINGVGYPNPNRSHFESLGIWHRGLLDSKRESGAGWLGKALDISRDADGIGMDGYFVGTQAVSASLVSRRAQVAALSRFADLRIDNAIQAAKSTNQKDDIAAFVQRQFTSAYKTSKQIEEVAKAKLSGGFPSSRLGQQLRLISQLIKSESAARVYYTVQSGYDTHSAQPNTHAGLLSEFSRSLKSFVDDLKTNDLQDRVVVMAFSEFGRRVQENASVGTDHGTAGPLILSGTNIKGGFMGEKTSLTDLEGGDLKQQFDFRSVYATLLNQWLGIDAETVLGKKFKELELFS